MLRQAAFINTGRFLKGELHCHTTRSDGHGAPKDVMAIYAAKGFDFLAITDHRVYNYKTYAPETGITIIPAMEMDRDISSEAGMCFHIVSIGPQKDNGNGFEQEQQFESGTVADQSDFQGVLDMLHENGNMTIYCHPEWSCTPARSYEKMKGNFAMEIWNTGCVFEDDMDKNAAGWDELLVNGVKIYGVATDDGHSMDQHGHGWVMVKSENNVSAILSALKAGEFYASTGPEIKDFYIDGDIVCAETSPCAFISVINGTFPNRTTRAAEGKTITQIRTKLIPGSKYVRVSCVDENGMRAWSNPIFLDGRK